MEIDTITKTDHLVEETKKLQNEFLHFLIKNKLGPVFQNWSRTSTNPNTLLPTISGMPLWIHNMQQFCVDKPANDYKFQHIRVKILDNHGINRMSIDESDADITLAAQLLRNEPELVHHINIINLQQFRNYVKETKDHRNIQSHYVNKTSFDTKLADVRNSLNSLRSFISFMINDFNSLQENTNDLEAFNLKIYTLETNLHDISSEHASHIEQLSLFRDYASKLKNHFLDFLSHYIKLDVDEEQLPDFYTGSMIDEVLQNSKTIPRRGKIEQVINTIQEKKMLLSGSPGAGKTTSLDYLAYLDAKAYLEDESLPIPIILRLNSLTVESMSVLSKIASDINCSPAYLTTLLQQNQVRIYLDGLNEIPQVYGSDNKQKRITEIKELVKNYSNVLLVISSRESDLEYFHDIPCFRILPLSKELLTEFIQKNSPSENVKEILLKELNCPHGLFKSLSLKTPLYITRLISVVSETGEIPISENRIIGDYLRSLLNREHYEKSKSFDCNKVFDLLTEFAYIVRDKYQTNVPVKRSSVIKIFDSLKIYPSEQLYDILNLCTELEILLEDSSISDSYAFAHETYQEFFRAEKDDFAF